MKSPLQAAILEYKAGRFDQALLRPARSDDENHNRLPSYDTFMHGLCDQPPAARARRKPGPKANRLSRRSAHRTSRREPR